MAQLDLFETVINPSLLSMEVVKDELQEDTATVDGQRSPMQSLKRGDVIIQAREMLNQDDRIAGDFFKFTHLLLATPFHIIASSEEPAAIERAEFVEKNFNNLEIPLKVSLEAMMEGIIFGFAVCEKLYKLEDGKIKLRFLKPKEPTAIKFKTDQYRNLLYVMNGDDKVEVEKLAIGVFPNAYGENRHYGWSMLTPLYEWYQLKKKVRKWMAMGIEQNIDPPTVGSYNRTLTDKDQKVAKGIIDDLKAFTTITHGFDVRENTAGSATVIPDIQIQKIETKTAKEIWEFINKLISDIDKRISRIFSIPEDLTGDSVGGSYARSKEQYNYIALLMAVVQEWLQDIINTQVIPTIELHNYSPEEMKKNGFSKFVFQEDERFTKEKAEVVKILKEAGVKLDIEWLYNQLLFIPMPEDVDEPEKLETDEAVEEEEVDNAVE